MNFVVFLQLLGGSMILGALTGQFLLGDYQVSFALGFGFLAFICVINWPSRPLPNGGQLNFPAREGLLYTAADGRVVLMNCYSPAPYHKDFIHPRTHWGHTDGPLVTDEEWQIILFDIADYYRRAKKGHSVIAEDGTIMADVDRK